MLRRQLKSEYVHTLKVKRDEIPAWYRAVQEFWASLIIPIVTP